MKILHLTNHFFPCIGGIERVVFDFCSALTKKGHECRVVCYNKCANSNKELAPSQEINGIKVIRLPFLDLKYYKITKPFLKLLRGADIVHVHGLGFFSDFVLLTKFIHRKPIVVSSHGAIFHTGSNFLKNLYFYFWNRLLLRNADKIIAVSEADKEIFSRIVLREKIELIENPLDFKKFRGKKKEKNSFLFVGRLSKNKRIDLLIESFALVAKKKKNFTLSIVGNDFDGIESALKKRAKEKGVSEKIEFLGPLVEKELLELYAKSDFFVSASEYEGFGISAIEAMASGCIPLLNGIDSFKKFIDEGKNGFLVDYSSPVHASEKILKAMELDPQKKESIRSMAIESVKRFSLENQAKKLLRVYERILS